MKIKKTKYKRDFMFVVGEGEIMPLEVRSGKHRRILGYMRRVDELQTIKAGLTTYFIAKDGIQVGCLISSYRDGGEGYIPIITRINNTLASKMIDFMRQNPDRFIVVKNPDRY